jgi:prevent-host-death family protein
MTGYDYWFESYNLMKPNAALGWAVVTVETISLTEFRRNLDEVITRAAHGHERIVLIRKGEVVAALVSINDLKRLEAGEQAEQRQAHVQQQLALLDEARAFREQMKAQSIMVDSTDALNEVREDRADDIAGLR